MSEFDDTFSNASSPEDLATSYCSERRLPELALWSAVICRAVTDAVQGNRPAREWLLQECEDFLTVCSLAGVSPVSVRSAAQRLIQNAAL